MTQSEAWPLTFVLRGFIARGLRSWARSTRPEAAIGGTVCRRLVPLGERAPRSLVKTPISSVRRHSRTRPPRTALHVLVVDDEPDVCEALRQILENEGYLVTTETTAHLALESVVSNTYDLVLADVAMPETDGITLCQQVCGVRPGLPIVLVTGRADLSTVTKALRVGARDFLTKPLDMVALLSTVARIIGHPADQATASVLPQEVAGIPSELKLASLLGESDGMKRVRKLILDLGDSVASVVIQGETGTGKEIIAQSLHAMSKLSAGPFI